MIEQPQTVEYRPTCLVIVPGIEFDEWQAAWESLDQTGRSINWLVGDALAWGQDFFPDRWSQVLNPKYAEQHRGALRVARMIPREYRRDPEVLSWSAHREACAADTLEERIELLDLAEANGWGARDVAVELKRRRRTGSNMGPPLDVPDPPGSTWNNGEPINGKPVPVALGGAKEPNLEALLADLPSACCGAITFSEEIAGGRLYRVVFRTPGGKLLGSGRGQSLSSAAKAAIVAMLQRNKRRSNPMRRYA